MLVFTQNEIELLECGLYSLQNNTTNTSIAFQKNIQGLLDSLEIESRRLSHEYDETNEHEYFEMPVNPVLLELIAQ
jgi:hypothetical protein